MTPNAFTLEGCDAAGLSALSVRSVGAGPEMGSEYVRRRATQSDMKCGLK